MAQIVQAFVGDSALLLQDEEFLRMMPWGSSWKKLMICLNVSISQIAGSLNPYGLYVGLTEGITGFKSGPVEWVGGWATGSWAYTAGPPAGIGVGGTMPNFGYKVGGSLNILATFGVGLYIGKTNRSMWTLSIEQTATGYRAGFNYPQVVPATDLYGSNFQASACSSEPVNTFAMSYVGGRKLDCVSVYWNYPSVGLEVSEILVVRLA